MGKQEHMEAAADVLRNLQAIKGDGFCLLARVLYYTTMMHDTAGEMLRRTGAPPKARKAWDEHAEYCQQRISEDIARAIALPVGDCAESRVWARVLAERLMLAAGGRAS